MSTRKELQEIADNMIRERNTHTPALQVQNKKTITPFGEVWSKLFTLVHARPLRKGEILAQWVRNRKESKTKFVWLGVVERSEKNWVTLKYTIYYRSFVNQYEKEEERMRQLYTKQLR